MNCKEYQEIILNALAGGTNSLSPELSAHQQSCAACRAFSEIQAALFRSIDSGLLVISNPEMPSSLLSGVRIRLAQQPTTLSAWRPSWSLAAVVAAVAILTMSVVHVRRRPDMFPDPPARVAVRSPISNTPPSIEQSPGKSTTASSMRSAQRKPVILPVPAQLSPEALPEVMVLVEERTAFAKFVAGVQQEKEVALPVARPSPSQPDSVIEIALLRIEEIALQPLESTPGN